MYLQRINELESRGGSLVGDTGSTAARKTFHVPPDIDTDIDTGVLSSLKGNKSTGRGWEDNGGIRVGMMTTGPTPELDALLRELDELDGKGNGMSGAMTATVAAVPSIKSLTSTRGIRK